MTDIHNTFQKTMAVFLLTISQASFGGYNQHHDSANSPNVILDNEDNHSDDYEPHAPIVVASSPAIGETQVALNSGILIQFGLQTFSDSGVLLIITDCHGNHVYGSTSYDSGDKALLFTPEKLLVANETYTVTVKYYRHQDYQVIYSWQFTTGATVDSTGPVIIATAPQDGTSNWYYNDAVFVAFDDTMNPFSISDKTVAVLDANNKPLPGYVTYDVASSIVSFKPQHKFVPNATYQLAVYGGARGVQSLTGTVLSTDYFYSFTTATVADTVAPTINSTDPSCHATGVPTNQMILASFSEYMSPSSISILTVALYGPDERQVAGLVEYDLNTSALTFQANKDLTPNTRYTLIIYGGPSGVLNAAGIPQSGNYAFSFTTGSGPDIIPPAVVSSYPLNGATNFPGGSLIFQFSEAIDPDSLSNLSFSLTQVTGGATTKDVSSGVVLASSEDGTTVTIFDELEALTMYIAEFLFSLVGTKDDSDVSPSVVTDLSGIPLAAGYSITFTTGSSTTGPVTVPLGAADSFAALAQTDILGDATTQIVGDVGTVEGTVVDISSDQVTGTINQQDAAAENAYAAFLAAYANAALRSSPIPTTALPNDLGGLVLGPGVYKFTSDVANSGILTIDGQNDPNSVVIFQIDGDLNFYQGTQVILTNQADGNNIFWQVGGSVVLEDGVYFSGNLLGYEDMSTGDSTVVEGRLMAGVVAGSITLTNSSISLP